MEQMSFFDIFAMSQVPQETQKQPEEITEEIMEPPVEEPEAVSSEIITEVQANDSNLDIAEEPDAVTPVESESEDDGIEITKSVVPEEKAEDKQPAKSDKPAKEEVPDFLKIAEAEGKDTAVTAKLDYFFEKVKSRKDTVGCWTLLFDHLRKRCSEDEGLADDLLQEHKTYDRFMGYFFGKAKDLSEKLVAYIGDDNIVFEWAEDYFRLDDREEIEKQKAKAAESKAKADEAKAKSEKKPKKAAVKKAQKPAPEKEEFRQIDFGALFS